MVLYSGCGCPGQKEMRSKIKIRHWLGLVLLSYQITIDFLQETTLGWYYKVSESIGGINLPDTYEGPILWVGILILHRAIIHTFVVYCWTGNKNFTHFYGLLEIVLLVGLVTLYILKYLLDGWKFISFEIFETFLQLLKSPMLLVVFLPSYYLFKN